MQNSNTLPFIFRCSLLNWCGEPVKLGIKVASLATYARNEWIQPICVNEKAKFIVKVSWPASFFIEIWKSARTSGKDQIFFSIWTLSNFPIVCVNEYLCELAFGPRGRSQTTFTKFVFFWPRTPLRLHFLWYKSLQKVNFFDHLPPSSCKRSLWTPPYRQQRR